MDNIEYNRKLIHIYHMNALIRSLNDEDAVMAWLTNGVPDGTISLEQIQNTYDNDEFFEYDYDALVELFCKIIGKESKNGTKCKALFA